MNDKDFEKTKHKTERSIQQSTSVPIFSQFEELQIVLPNWLKKYERK